MVDLRGPGDAVGGAAGFTVPRTPRSVVEVRRFVVGACASLGWGGSTDTVALLVTEVATNAVLHARGRDICVRVARQDERLRVEVDDGSSELPSTRDAVTAAEDGRGLAIVQALASGWGVDRRDGGKTFWFEIEP